MFLQCCLEQKPHNQLTWFHQNEVDALEFAIFRDTGPKDDQRYGMVEAISHLVHRDYAEIGHLVSDFLFCWWNSWDW